MERMSDFTFGLALMKLEEELGLLRQVAFRLPENLRPEETLSLLNRAVALLRAGSDLLAGLGEEVEPGWARDVVFSVFEALFIVQTLLERLEGHLPLFFDGVSVFEEPLIEKLRQVVDALHSYAGHSAEPLDFDELSYILQEIAKTLEVELVRSKHLMEKVV
ncbi:MAG: hypothetical protein GXO08_03365 [Aquificae bacterium]|nr:hypothetical protein [Aquificota bacterium]